jgi:hypothetical protein
MATLKSINYAHPLKKGKAKRQIENLSVLPTIGWAFWPVRWKNLATPKDASYKAIKGVILF